MTVDAIAVREQRKVVTLLSILVGLMALMFVALVVGGVIIARKLAETNAPAKVDQTLDELTTRQRTAAARLDDVADRTSREVATLERRARNLTGVDSGPMDKMAQMIALQQVMVDEMFILLRHVSASQQALAAALRPLPIQRDAEPDTRRQSAKKDEAKKDDAPKKDIVEDGPKPGNSPASAAQPEQGKAQSSGGPSPSNRRASDNPRPTK